jgi:hypothetical protein
MVLSEMNGYRQRETTRFEVFNATQMEIVYNFSSGDLVTRPKSTRSIASFIVNNYYNNYMN